MKKCISIRKSTSNGKTLVFRYCLILSGLYCTNKGIEIESDGKGKGGGGLVNTINSNCVCFNFQRNCAVLILLNNLFRFAFHIKFSTCIFQCNILPLPGYTNLFISRLYQTRISLVFYHSYEQITNICTVIMCTASKTIYKFSL